MLRLTLSLRHATHAVILRVILGGFLSPNDSRRALTADDEEDDMMDSEIWSGMECKKRKRRTGTEVEAVARLPYSLTALLRHLTIYD